MNWQTFLTISHIIGTVLGVGGATFAEVFYWKTAKQGLVSDPVATSFSKTVYRVIRIGTIILVLSGFGYLLLSRFEGQAQHIYSVRVWAKMIITLIILMNAILMQTRRIPFWLGSAVSLTSWYAALVIGAWRMRAGFAEIMAIYIAAIFGIAILQHLLHKFWGLESKKI